jgi:uncharacterized repeat protein (TIGR03803 family)
MPAMPRRTPFTLLCSLSFAALLLQAPARAQDEEGPAVSTVLAFSGSRTFGNVVPGPGNDLYGALSTTIGGSTGGLIFKVARDGSSVTTLYQLGEEDGVSPQAGLLVGSDGVFYGTTHFGKRETDAGLGTVFSVRTDGSDFTTLHAFATSDEQNQDDNPINEGGAFPDATLVEGSDGFLYGVTRAGGENGTGTIFKVAKNGTGFSTLHEFGEITSDEDEPLTENADGAYPAAGLIESNGYFYGTTPRGGANGRGTIFRLRFDGSEFGLVHVFTDIVEPDEDEIPVNEDGATPLASLLDGGDGLLYGVTSQGGANGLGTLFSVTPAGDVFTTLHDFTAKRGSVPTAAPIVGRDGNLWGTTSGGGVDEDDETTTFGTIYTVARDGSAFERVFSFNGSLGASPNSPLLQLGDNVFVGTTSAGGRCSEGVIFRLDLTGDTVEGETSCGSRGNDSGGGATAPAWLVLLGAWGALLAARRRHGASARTAS